MRSALINAIWLGSLALAAAPLLAADEASPYEAVLKSAEIEADAPSLRKYLLALHPNAETRSEISTLIAQLGDDDFHRREQAMKALLRMPAVAVDLMQRAVEASDPEISWRAKQIHRHAEQASRDLLHAAFLVIEKKKLQGELVEPLLAAIPLCSDEYLRDAARRALAGSAAPEDESLLRRFMKHADPQVRIAALVTLSKVQGEKADEQFLPLLADEDERVRAVVGRTLLNHGRREALAPLVALLDSPELATRLSALRTLKLAVGQDFGFVAFQDAKLRAAAREKWQTWIESEGQTAALKFPLPNVEPLLGRTLISYYSQNLVVEFDSAGKETWRKTGVPNPWACQGLPNGHRLVACYAQNSVIEYDESGNEVWKKTGLPGNPFSVQRLPDGNTLIACSNAQRVIEVKPDGSTAWEASTPGMPRDARRLEDGRTLVALTSSHKVVEIDSSGKVVWSVEQMQGASSVQRLENGNTLIACMNQRRVVEVDKNGKEVWSKININRPYSAQRLPNGNTLVAEQTGVVEYDVEGKPVGEKLGQNLPSGVSRY